MTTTERLHQYALLIRWDKPIGSLLLLWPTLTALFIAGAGRPKALIIFVFTIGVFLIRSAGCILNDIFDRKFDKKVARTKDRPLATGKITVLEAILICGIFLLIAFALVLLLNLYTIILAIIGAILALIYPLMKRFTQLPQVFLGIAFNWGIPMAFAAQTNHIPFIAWLLYVIALVWTVAYDTMYAMVDRDDDLKIGIKSTAILFGHHDHLIVGGLQTVVILLLLALGFILQVNFWYDLAVLACLLLFAYQQYLIKDRKPALCFKAFLNNHWAWLVVFFGVYLSYSP